MSEELERWVIVAEAAARNGLLIYDPEGGGDLEPGWNEEREPAWIPDPGPTEQDDGVHGERLPGYESLCRIRRCSVCARRQPMSLPSEENWGVHQLESKAVGDDAGGARR